MNWKKIEISVPDFKMFRYWWVQSLHALQGNHVRDWMAWGTYGKSGKDPLKWVILKNMSDEHIKAILSTQPQINSFYRDNFEKELKRREKNPALSITETI